MEQEKVISEEKDTKNPSWNSIDFQRWTEYSLKKSKGSKKIKYLPT